MKVALVHDTLLEFGGAERTLVSLLKLFPEADLYTSLASPGLRQKFSQLTTGSFKTSCLSRLPAKKKYASWLKPLIFCYWRSLNLSEYDLVISSSHSFNSKAVKTGKTPHLSIIYTPPRYLYDQFNENGLISRSPLSFLFQPFLWLMRKADYKISQEIEQLVAISSQVKNRINQYYQRSAVIIHPPLRAVPQLPKQAGEYYVCLSRLVKQKGLDLAIKTCNQLEEQLVVIGQGPQERYLKKIAGPTVKFFGYLEDEQVAIIFQKAKALIYPSIEEDFGLVPLEAMAHGVPVVAYKSGATPEYIQPEKTGIFFNNHSIESLAEAIEKFEKQTWSDQECRQFSQKFSEKNFHRQLTKLIKKIQLVKPSAKAETTNS